MKIVVSDDGKVEVTTKFDISSTNTNPNNTQNSSIEVIFVRRNATPITPNNIELCLDIHTIKGSPVESLYNVLKAIWCPTLLENDLWSEKLPPRVQQLLSDLENSLHTTNTASTNDNNSRNSNDIDYINNILEPADEFSYWRQVKDDRRSPNCHLARLIDIEYNKLSQQGLNDLHNININEFEALLSLTFDCLNNIWVHATSEADRPYPQIRMTHMFGLLGQKYMQYFQKYLNNMNIFDSNTNTNNTTNTTNSSNNSYNNSSNNIGENLIKLNVIYNLCQKWCDIPRSLTRSYWSSNNNNNTTNTNKSLKYTWKGDIYTDIYSESYKLRIQHIIYILSTIQELTQLLSVEEQKKYPSPNFFRPFLGLRPFFYNPYTQSQWDKAMLEFDQFLIPIENIIITRFKAQLASLSDRPTLLMAEFQRHPSLLNRPGIRKLLVAEREMLFTSVKDLVKRVEGEVDGLEGDWQDHGSRGGGGSGGGAVRMLTPIASKIIKLRQLSQKLIETKSVSASALSDLTGYDRFASSLDSLVARIQTEERSTYQNWLQDTQQKLDDDDSGSSKLSLRGSLLTWDQGLLTVSYSSELMLFAREVRQLQELGYDMPKPSKTRSKEGNTRGILDLAYDAERFYRYGILLQKTATFYNSLSEHILDIQEQLLLDSLSAFANIVSKYNDTNNGTGKISDSGTIRGNSGGGSSASSTDISWSNPIECEQYIHTLQQAAERLSKENRQLRQLHDTLIQHTIILMNIDFLKQTNIWKTQWKLIKNLMNNIKTKYNVKNYKLFIYHWDHQIYKALEVSYQLGLESLNENLPEIKVDLVYIPSQVCICI